MKDSEMNKMTDEQRYLYDLNGYLVVKDALDRDEINVFTRSLKEHFGGKALLDVSFSWGRQWAELIDHKTTYPILSELFQDSVRLDHAFSVNEKFGNKQNLMHHEAVDGFSKNIFHVVHGGKINSGLVGIIYSLLDNTEESGSFCCIPGSHKSNFSTPKDYFNIQNNPFALRVPVKAGDAIVFNEAMTHGTWLPKANGRRLAIMMKYTYGHSAFRQPFDMKLQTKTAPTPNYEHDGTEGNTGLEYLTERQKRIIALPPFYRGRDSFELG